MKDIIVEIQEHVRFGANVDRLRFDERYGDLLRRVIRRQVRTDQKSSYRRVRARQAWSGAIHIASDGDHIGGGRSGSDEAQLVEMIFESLLTSLFESQGDLERMRKMFRQTSANRFGETKIVSQGNDTVRAARLTVSFRADTSVKCLE